MRYLGVVMMLGLVGAGPVSTYEKKVGEGNWLVTVTIGGEADVTVKGEQRRLMLEHVKVPKGEEVKRRFVVNVRTVEIAGGGHVKLKAREKEAETLEWDDRLSLEFLGTKGAVKSVEVERASVPTVYILGDSTVCDQPREPWASWGQMLPRFLDEGVAVANYAESGETLRSSMGANRLAKVLSVIKPGDVMMVQFGHNDMKEKGEEVGPFMSYSSDLKRYVEGAKAKGAVVVLVTSMERKAGIEKDTLGDYPEAVRRVGKEEGVAVVDLHEMSKKLYKAMGEDVGKAFQDGTHHTNYGAYELAKCVVQGLKEQKVEAVTKFIVEGFEFDPSKPDAVGVVQIPASANVSTTKPEGN